MPAFIGYTSKAVKKRAGDLLLVPTKINSMREFENLFGFPYEYELEIKVELCHSSRYALSDFKEPSVKYLLYYSVKLYFENGGGTCYILSVDTYLDPHLIALRKNPWIQRFGLLDGLHKIAEVDEISLVVIPEAVKLAAPDYSVLVQAVLQQCFMLDNRFAIFDLCNGDNDNPDLRFERALFGSKYLSYGSAYFPFVATTINYYVKSDGSNVKVINGSEILTLAQLKMENNTLYRFAKNELKYLFVNLPSCSVIAATYFKSDKSRGVWKSPVNQRFSCVTRPVVQINTQLCEALGVDPDSGKTINSVRAIPGKGTVVCGAKTLAGNESSGKYIPVRRFVIMVKESISKSIHWASFEPNNAVTWLKIKIMIENYLTKKWQEGALAGVTPQSAFFVNCGDTTTMNEQDIFEGRIVVEVGLAMLCPGEFTVMRFSQQLRMPRRKSAEAADARNKTD